jgi:hypothetical protein
MDADISPTSPPYLLAKNQRRNARGGLFLQRWDRVRVGVQGDRHGGMAVTLGDDLGMDASLQR